jgi:hypothetical protein
MWNYRIIKDGDDYGLYEVFYNVDGKISAHTLDAEVVSCSPEEIVKTLRLMLDDAEKSSYNVLEMDKIEFAPLYDEDEELIEVKDLNDLIKKTDKRYE